LALDEKMSADLLAEFGQPEASKGQGNRDFTGNESLRRSGGNLIPPISEESLGTQGGNGKGKQQEELWHTDEGGADVLFDVSTDQYDLDDEFGDFEGEQPEDSQNQLPDLLDTASINETTKTSKTPPLDLLDSDINPSPLQSARTNNVHDEWGDFSTAVESGKAENWTLDGSTKSAADRQVPLVETDTVEEEWDAFDDGEEASVASSPSQPATSHDMITKGVARPNIKTITSSEADKSRPTNIPPPAILLQILPRVFSEGGYAGNVQLPIESAKSVVQAFTVASRLIAGRALRWKRDTILGQSTKIGPAGGGRKGGGMKLAAVDKSESLKEEREVADVLQAWEEHAHVFNSIVNKAGIRRPLMILSGTMKPRPAGGAEVLTSAHACALCGLKRNERVFEADIDVNDSFGDFWSEHWGHRDCKDFWYHYQRLLPQR
jgi:hypothetical protein